MDEKRAMETMEEKGQIGVQVQFGPRIRPQVVESDSRHGFALANLDPFANPQ